MKLLLAAFLPLAAWAASLSITVQDPSGAVIAAASIRVKTGGAEFTAATDVLGQAALANLPVGRATVRVEAAGFTPQDLNVNLRVGENRVRARMQIATRQDAVTVSEDKREAAADPRGNIASTVLTAKEIEALPDDPDEMKAALEAMAGPGATFRVDGFRGGRLPHKSQIQSIRFRLTPYSVEEHDDGFNLVDITTKPGLGIWHGTATYAYGGDALNARNFFAATREPQQAKRVDFNASGPLVKNKTSLSLAYGRNDTFDSKATHGVLPAGPFANLVRLPSNSSNANARVQQALPKAHALRFEYQYASFGRSNLGTFDLHERLSTSSMDQHVLRISDSGMLTGKVIHDARFQIQWTNTSTGAISSAPAIVVPGAFSQGGAGSNSRRNAREMDWTEGLTFNHGRHNFRTGFELDGAAYRDRDLSNANGTFTFASLAAYQAGQPLTFTQLRGDVAVNYRQYQFGAFLQDDIRVRKNFSASIGLRYETQTNMSDRVNFAPRGGITWAPFRSAKTTIRVGGGIYSQWFDATLYEQVLRVNGSGQSNLVIQQPGYPNPLAGGSLGAALPPSIITRDSHLVMPYLVRGSAGVSQQVAGLFNLNFDYRVQRGIHLLRSRNLNAPLADGLRPDPALGNINQIESAAGSSLRGFVIGVSPVPMTASGRMRKLFWFMNYQHLSNIDETDSALSLPTNSFNPRADRGPALTDARHRFGTLANYNFGRGFQIGSFFRANSALPYNLTTGFDNNGDTAINDRPAGVGRNSARGAAFWDVSLKVGWTAKFGKPRSETGGMPMRIMIRGDSGGVPDLPGMGSNGLAQVNFYVQAYNLMNHANMQGFVGVATSPLYGMATAATAGRRIELGTKISF